MRDVSLVTSMRLLGTAWLLLTLAGVALVAQGQAPPPEQKVFSDSVQHPVSLGPDVLRALLASHPAKETFDILDDSEKRDPSQFFQAAEVHLNTATADEVDLIVMGQGRMKGAEGRWFWVVRSARKNPDVVLFSGGDSLEVTDGKTHGYKDIRVVWMSSLETETTIYQFDGNVYQTRSANNFKILTTNP